MTNHLTEIIFILDKSTSMGFLKEQAIDGFNSFLKEQQSLGEKANLTLVLIKINSFFSIKLLARFFSL